MSGERLKAPPPYLVGLALLFWGWQTGYLAVGALMAVILEGARWTKVRWEFADEDFTRIWTFCSLVLLAGAVYLFTANDAPSDLFNLIQNPNLRTQRNAGNSSARAIAELLRWQPMIFFPFIAAATYSVREGIPLHTISIILRWRWQKTRPTANRPKVASTVNIAYPYFLLSLFSASVHESSDTYFFWGASALVAWALWPQRSRRFKGVSWACLLGAAVGLGYLGQMGISQLQQYIGGLNPHWLLNYSRYRFDPRQTRTALGHVGSLKASGAIVIRVRPKDPNSRVPGLLREASYGNYRGQVWYGSPSRADFENIQPETNQTSWVLVPGKTLTTTINIACYLPGGQALLPLPRGSSRLENLHAFILQKNKFGAVSAEGPGLVIFDALYGPGATTDNPPETETDPAAGSTVEREALRQIIDELHLEGRPLQETMQAIQRFFSSKFSYATWQDGPVLFKRGETPLSRFLLKSRKGHCEYFATATVLLLRELGFPARYAVGYAVHERSGKDGYVVRQRDAHAWCLVYYNDLWHDFDTTPNSWFETEARRASPFQSLSDFWSRIWFEIARIRWGQSNLRQYFLWSLAPVLSILLIQIFRTRRKRHGKRDEPGRAQAEWPGLDSEFYLLANKLAESGLPRLPGEPVSEWFMRAASDAQFQPIRESLQRLLRLHYRYRFDPAGLNASERQALRDQAVVCLARVSHGAPGP